MTTVTLDIRDARLTAIIDPETQLEQLLTGFKFTEGPIWHPYEGHLRFSDIIGNSIFQWSAADGLKDIRPNSHLANGNTYDRQGRMLTCHHASSRVTRTERDGSVTVMAAHYQGKQLNSPNDIIVKRDGMIYFTDPRAGREPRFGIPREPELPFAGVYRLHPETLALTLLVDDFAKPNGLCFSLDEQQLYINDTQRLHIRVFDVTEDGLLRGGRLWAETSGEGVGVPDGMKFDRAGHLFCCGPGGVHVFSADAVCLGVIRMPEQATNFIWGDADLRSLYITATTSVYRLRVNVPGLPLF
ncbi:MAG: SMP-30/gluconolactonase/LRE family protein [Chloroflexi bacterium]|nr:SMP-30/gluconolactonase/LRE family protein [Chloroflexota bacterium]